MAASTPMMAMTVSSSMSVNAARNLKTLVCIAD
jgi:hypothetical protein